MDVGDTLEATISGLADCTTSYFAVKAYNFVGECPDFSNEISGWPRPTVDSATPAAALQGSRLTLDVTGTNFEAGATLEIDNPDVFMGQASTLSCNQIQVATTVEPTARGVRPAEIGNFTVTVVNPDDVYGDLPRAFAVLINEARFDVNTSDATTQGRVDGKDTVSISRPFGSRDGDPTYDPDADFNGDGWVDGTDLAYIAANLGRCWSGNAWTVAACPESLR